MHLVVVRHGESEYNKSNLVCGISDSKLTEKGLSQAIRLKEVLSTYKFSVVYTSPLIRAIETAKIITGNNIAQIVIDERLIERNYGDYEGCDETLISFKEIKWELGIRMPGQGESIFQMIQRVYSFLDDLKSDNVMDTVIIVCHCGICRIINSYFQNMSNKDFIDYYINNSNFPHSK